MLDMVTTGTFERAPKRAKASAKRAKQSSYVLTALVDADDYGRVFIATGTAREVSKLVRTANSWHSQQMRRIGKCPARICQRELATVRKAIRSAHAHGHWYVYNDTIDAVVRKYCPWPK